MFGDHSYARDKAQELLDLYYLEEVLELNDLTDHEVLELLITRGLIRYPETLMDQEIGDEDD